jgi:predicted Zn-dependent protease
MRKLLIALLCALLALAGCVTSPVTGESHFQLYGADWERQVGARMYAPMKQSEGGEFLLDPALTAYVESVGQRLARQARRGDELDFEFSVLNESTPNAWALPGGKIVINRGLLTELDSEAELAAVLAHEIVHADAAHGARSQSTGMLTEGAAMLTMVILGSQLESEAGRQVALLVPALGAQLVHQKYSRDAERESDEYGMRYMSEAGYDPQGAVRLQETFLRLAENREPDWVSGLFASHPPSRERVENNIRTAKRLPSGGEIGRERYLEKTSYLRRVQPAYDAFDEAREALADGNKALARSRIQHALAIEPREALFHILAGDIEALERRDDRAIAAYRKALERNPGFFLAHLRLGQLEYRRNRPDRARPSLQRSLDLLPTAEAHYLLGLIAQHGGESQQALEHFRAAASSDSETGRKAGVEIARIELPADPSRYVPSRAALDRNLAVWAQFQNRSELTLSDVEITYVWVDQRGQTQQARKRYNGTLSPGEQGQIALGVTLDDPSTLERRVRVTVSGARIVD